MIGLTKALLGGVSVLTVSAIIAPALAQSDDNNNKIETVVVTGIRASLKSAQSLKRNSDVIQDSISAEDIGALPDRTVTEALQRVPGVSINYFAGPYDPDHFAAEGSGVIIRGLSDTQSLFNNRDAFSSNNGRILSFADVPSELLSGVDVYKSSEADMIEGGIGGTVNLRTRLPFDQDGQLIGFSVDTTVGDKTNKWTINGSGLYSNDWSTPAGEFGILVDASHSRLYTTSFGSQIAAWGPIPNGTDGCTQNNCFAPTGADVRTDNYMHDRTGYAAAAQWKSNDDTMLATVQFIRSDSKENWSEHAIDVAADVVNGTNGSVPCPSCYVNPVPGTTWGYSGDGLFDNGMITQTQPNYGYWRSADPSVPGFGTETSFTDRGVIQEYITNDVSGHFRWTPTDKWDIELDAQHVWASTNNLDVTSDIAGWTTVDIQQRGGSWDNIPNISFLPPTNNATGVADPNPWFSDPGNYFWRDAMDHIEDSRGTENAFQADTEYQLGWFGFLDSIKIGARYADREQDVRYTTYNWGALSETWNGSTGPVWLGQNSYTANCSNFYSPAGSPGCGNTYAGPGPGDTLPANARNPAMISGANLASVYSFPNFQGGGVPSNVGMFYNGNPAANYAKFSQQMLAIESLWPGSAAYNAAHNGTPNCSNHGLNGTGGGGWYPLSGNCIDPGSPFEPEDVSPISDKRTAFYGMLNFGDNGPVTGNLGVRWIHSDEGSAGDLEYPTSLGASLEGNGSLPSPVCTGLGTPPAICVINAANPALAQKIVQFCAPVNTGIVDVSTGKDIWNCSGGINRLSGRNSFDELLPSLNMKIHLTDDMLVRIGLSQSVTYPDMGLLRDFQNVSILSSAALSPTMPFGINLSGNGSAGNPNLKPTKSNNMDASYEWYFSSTGSLSLAVFRKSLHDVITDEFSSNPYTNNGETFNIISETPANAATVGHVQGYELSYQQFFDFLPDPFDGAGADFNYTFVQSGGVAPLDSNAGDISPGAIPGAGCVGGSCIANFDYSKLPLEGISKQNVNIEALYSKGPFDFRLAYNWRSRFLLTTRDVIYPFAPIFNEPTGTLDGSFFYSIDDHIKIGVQGENLLNEVTRTTQVISAGLETAPRSWFTTDRRISLILRGTF